MKPYLDVDLKQRALAFVRALLHRGHGGAVQVAVHLCVLEERTRVDRRLHGDF